MKRKKNQPFLVIVIVIIVQIIQVSKLELLLLGALWCCRPWRLCRARGDARPAPFLLLLFSLTLALLPHSFPLLAQYSIALFLLARFALLALPPFCLFLLLTFFFRDRIEAPRINALFDEDLVGC